MKKNSSILLLIIILPLLLMAQTEDSLSTPKSRHYFLEGIRVIAERPQESIGSIEFKDFSKKIIIPEFNLGESVSDINGVSLTTGGKSGADINIRGFNDKQVKIMLDGRPLSGGYYGSVDINTIPLSEVKEIQVLKGPVSSLYGSDTMGGVVNIITRSPSNDHLIKTGFIAKRNNTNKIYLSTSRDLGNWDYWVYASRFNTEGFVLSDDFSPMNFENGKVRDRNAREQYDLQAKVNWTLFDFHSFGIQIGYTFMNKHEITSSIYESLYRQFTDWKRYQVSGIASLQLSPYILLDSNIYYDQNDDIYAEYADPNYEQMYMQWPSTLSSWTFGFSEKLVWDNSENLKTIWGYRFEKQVYNRKDNGSYSEWTSNNINQHNTFFQAELSFNRLTISSGVGLALFKQKGRDSWISHTEPALGIYYRNSSNWKASVSYSLNSKYPTLHELYSSSSGNSELREESARKYEIALDIPFILNKASGSVSQKVFYNNISDLITKTNQRYVNNDKVDSYGYEVSLKLKLLWEHQIDFFQIKFTDESDYSLLEVAENTINIIEKIKLPYEVGLRYKVTWKDERKTEIDNLVLDPYWLHSVYFSRNFNDVKLLFGLENIFDTNYMEEYGFPGEGFNFIISMEAELF